MTRRLQHAGETAGEYIRARTLRLARPVFLAMLGVLAVVAAMALSGADGEFLRSCFSCWRWLRTA